MKISKHYEENAIVGSFQSVKIGLTIHSDKELKSAEEVKEFSGKLNMLAKHIVREELRKAKEEAEAKRELNPEG